MERLNPKIASINGQIPFLKGHKIIFPLKLLPTLRYSRSQSSEQCNIPLLLISVMIFVISSVDSIIPLLNHFSMT